MALPIFYTGPHVTSCRLATLIRTTEKFEASLGVCTCGRVFLLPATWQANENIVFYNGLVSLLTRMIESALEED